MEKQCSVTLSNLNVYCCLVCGKYFQGKGWGTPAYIHSLNQGRLDDHIEHNIFIGLSGAFECKIVVLPDNYEVFDASLNDIKFNLKPVYNKELVAKLDSEKRIHRSLEGSEYLPGCIGLNNLKLTDFANCVV